MSGGPYREGSIGTSGTHILSIEVEDYRNSPCKSLLGQPQEYRGETLRYVVHYSKFFLQGTRRIVCFKQNTIFIKGYFCVLYYTCIYVL